MWELDLLLELGLILGLPLGLSLLLRLGLLLGLELGLPLEKGPLEKGLSRKAEGARASGLLVSSGPMESWNTRTVFSSGPRFFPSLEGSGDASVTRFGWLGFGGFPFGEARRACVPRLPRIAVSFPPQVSLRAGQASLHVLLR